MGHENLLYDTLMGQIAWPLSHDLWSLFLQCCCKLPCEFIGEKC